MLSPVTLRYRLFSRLYTLVRRVCWKIKMSTNNGRPFSPQLISFDNEDIDGFEDNFGKDTRPGKLPFNDASTRANRKYSV